MLNILLPGVLQSSSGERRDWTAGDLLEATQWVGRGAVMLGDNS